jgi:hypothetical protein
VDDLDYLAHYGDKSVHPNWHPCTWIHYGYVCLDVAHSTLDKTTMKLRELEGRFTKYVERAVPPDQFVDGVVHPSGIERSYHDVATLAEADGVWFLCPKCFAENHGPSGTHMHMIGFAGRCPPGSYTKGSKGEDTRWIVMPSSTGLDDLSLTPSILAIGGCNWHGFVGSSGVPPGEAQ